MIPCVCLLTILTGRIEKLTRREKLDKVDSEEDKKEHVDRTDCQGEATIPGNDQTDNLDRNSPRNKKEKAPAQDRSREDQPEQAGEEGVHQEDCKEQDRGEETHHVGIIIEYEPKNIDRNRKESQEDPQQDAKIQEGRQEQEEQEGAQLASNQVQEQVKLTGTRPKQKKIKKSTGKKLKKKEELKELKKKEDCPRNKNKDIREMMRRWEERKEQRKDGGHSLGDTEDLQILDRSTPETPRIRNSSKEEEDGRDRGVGGGLESRKYTNNHFCQEDTVTGRKKRSILDQMMSGTRPKQKVVKKTLVRKTPVRKMVSKMENLPTEKAKNIGEVMRLRKERQEGAGRRS